MQQNFIPKLCFLIFLVPVLFTLGCSSENDPEQIFKKIVKKQSSPAEKPIPIVADKPTQKNFNKSYYSWLKRSIPDWYKNSAEQTGTFDGYVYVFLDNFCKYEADLADKPNLKYLLGSARMINNNQTPDSLMLVFYSYLLFLNEEYTEAEQVLAKSIPDLEELNHLHIHDYFAQLLMNEIHAQRETGTNSAQNFWEQKAAHSIVQALASGEFREDEARIAFLRIDEEFSTDNKGIILEELKSKKNISTWLLKMIEGSYETGYAWRWRGGGWGSEVTADGWEGFRNHLGKAEENLTEAWKIHPDYPEAATKMISVAMAGSHNSSLSERDWFDRAVAAQFDYQDAYDDYLWSLRPRWGGSHAKMHQFAQECLDTKRFDTDIPWFYLKVLRDIGTELPHNRWKSVFRGEEVQENLNKLFDGMLNEPSRNSMTQRIIAQKANVSLWRGQYVQARKLLASVKQNIDLSEGFCRKGISWSHREMARLKAEIDLFTGPHKKDMLRAESLNLEENNPEAARELYKKVMEAVKDNTVAYNHLREVIVSTMNTSLGFNVTRTEDPLHVAAYKNRPDMVRFLLQTGSTADPVNKCGKTPLHIAASKGNKETCGLLLDHGADINKPAQDQSTPLHEALQHHRLETAMFLINKGAKTNVSDLDGWTPLHHAIQGRHEEIALRLLDMDVDINALTDGNWSPLCLALSYDQAKVAWRLLEKKADINQVICGHSSTCQNESPLYLALFYKHYDIATWLIKNGADVNKVTNHQLNALHAAIERKQDAIVKLLVASGADINFPDSGGSSSLHRACTALPRVVPLLVDNGADIHAQTSNGWTPLGVALWYNHPQAAIYLVRQGADINRPNPHNHRTPLHTAAEKNFIDLARLLLEKGADPWAKDAEGNTAFDLAQKNNNIDILKIMDI